MTEPGTLPEALNEVRRLRAALKDIAEPLVNLCAEAKASGGRLNGYAVVLSNDANWLKEKARTALAARTPPPPEAPK